MKKKLLVISYILNCFLIITLSGCGDMQPKEFLNDISLDDDDLILWTDAAPDEKPEIRIFTKEQFLPFRSQIIVQPDIATYVSYDGWRPSIRLYKNNEVIHSISVSYTSHIHIPDALWKQGLVMKGKSLSAERDVIQKKIAEIKNTPFATIKHLSAFDPNMHDYVVYIVFPMLVVKNTDKTFDAEAFRDKVYQTIMQKWLGNFYKHCAGSGIVMDIENGFALNAGNKPLKDKNGEILRLDIYTIYTLQAYYKCDRDGYDASKNLEPLKMVQSPISFSEIENAANEVISDAGLERPKHLNLILQTDFRTFDTDLNLPPVEPDHLKGYFYRGPINYYIAWEEPLKQNHLQKENHN